MKRIVAGLVLLLLAQAQSVMADTADPTLTIERANPGITSPPRNLICPTVSETCSKLNMVEFRIDGGGAEGIQLYLDLVNSSNGAVACQIIRWTTNFNSTLAWGCTVPLETFTPGLYHWEVLAVNVDTGQSDEAISESVPWV